MADSPGTEVADPRVLRLAVMMEIDGFHAGEIAERLGVSEDEVQGFLESETAGDIAEEVEKSVIEQVAARGSQVQMKIRSHADEALSTLLDLMRFSENENTVQKAALAILDRGGYTPVNRQINLGVQIPKDVADRMESVLRDKQVVDAEYEVFDIEEARRAVGDG